MVNFYLIILNQIKIILQELILENITKKDTLCK